MIVGQPQMLKEVNKDIIRDLIYEKGPVSKPNLAQMTNLSLPTVNKIVDDLEKEGVIRQEGVLGSSTGRKAKLYVANEAAGNMITLYFQDSSYMTSLANIVGEKLFCERMPLDTSGREEALRDTFRAVDTLMERSDAPVRAVAVGVPGVVLANDTITSIPNIPGWEGLNLKELLTDRYGIPAYVENDVKLTTLGYYHTLLESRYDSMVYMYIGQGVGSGIIINRMLYKGYSSFAGELGYLACCERQEPVDYAGNGGWFERRIGALLLKEGSDERKRLEDLLAAAITNYTAALNPEVIVVQGKQMSEECLARVGEKLERYLPKSSLPRLLLNENEGCGTDGLISLCMANLSTSRQFVVRKGV